MTRIGQDSNIKVTRKAYVLKAQQVNRLITASQQDDISGSIMDDITGRSRTTSLVHSFRRHLRQHLC